ncbi:MAG: hypothetical protein M1833_006941 [Piccolia ochrophora]|nr:MAG: hypothetical protein M1833_006941 [Piccolia ochrophora]
MTGHHGREAASHRPSSPLQELEPSPVDSPADHQDEEYFHPKDAPSYPKSSSSLGLSGHNAIYYLTRIQRYSSYTFSAFLTFHITNTSIIPLVTRSVPASDPYLLLTRPYYQSPIAEPLVVFLPLVAHVGSGIALRIYRQRQRAKRYGAPSSTDRKQLAWPQPSGTSKLGYALTSLVSVHVLANRIVPLWVEGGSSGIDLSYVSHAFAKYPISANIAYGVFVGIACWHFTWGWLKWLGLDPAQAATGAVDKARVRKRRWYQVNAASAALALVWMAGGLGIVGRGGAVGGWIGREYDELYRKTPLIGSLIS